jgi:hypothetical protein
MKSQRADFFQTILPTTPSKVKAQITPRASSCECSPDLPPPCDTVSSSSSTPVHHHHPRSRRRHHHLTVAPSSPSPLILRRWIPPKAPNPNLDSGRRPRHHPPAHDLRHHHRPRTRPSLLQTRTRASDSDTIAGWERTPALIKISAYNFVTF